jgi:hypothetical protein
MLKLLQKVIFLAVDHELIKYNRNISLTSKRILSRLMKCAQLNRLSLPNLICDFLETFCLGIGILSSIKGKG